MQYAPSTRFYVADKLAGAPWATRLPFTVHVVERVETLDLVSRNRFVTRIEQLSRTYDVTIVSGDGLLKLLGTEFEGWWKKAGAN